MENHSSEPTPIEQYSMSHTSSESTNTTTTKSCADYDSSSETPKEQSVLPEDYEPCPHTVIVGRGREPKQNMGNKRLNILASTLIHQYQEGDKKSKTKIVSNIIKMIREACRGGRGAFVKHAKNGRWYDLPDTVAREKVGYIFRDLLADSYRSSSKSKVAKRARQILPCLSFSACKKLKTTAGPMNVNGNQPMVRSSAASSAAMSRLRMTSLGEIKAYNSSRIQQQYPRLELDRDEEIIHPTAMSRPRNSGFNFKFDDDFLSKLTQLNSEGI